MRRDRNPLERCALLALAALLLGAAPEDGGGGWELRDQGEAPGERYALYSRVREGSPFEEHRMEIVFDAAPAEVMAALEHNLLDPQSYPEGFERVLLRREDNVFVTHDTIRAPFIADRDVVLRIETNGDPEQGTYRMRWTAVHEGAPDPAEGVVRMQSSDGYWTLAPRASGGTRVVYWSHVEPGGVLPAFLVDAGNRRELVRQVAALRRALDARAKKGARRR